MTDIFSKFNPFDAAATKKEASDPRKVPAQPEPLRGVEPTTSTTSTQPNASPSSDKSPVDIMEEVWQTEVKPDASTVQQVKPEQIKELASKFKPEINPELLAEAQSDPEKFAELITNVTRQAFESATAVSSAMTTNYLTQERGALESRTKSHITKTSVLDEVNKLNPALTSSGPFKKMTEDLVAKYLVKFPDKSPAEVAKDVDAFVSTKLGIKKETSAPAKGEEETTKSTNWMEFLES